MQLRLIQEITLYNFQSQDTRVNVQTFSLNKLRRGDLLLSHYLNWNRGHLTARLQPDEQSVMIFGSQYPATLLNAQNPTFNTGIIPLDYATCEVTVILTDFSRPI